MRTWWKNEKTLWRNHQCKRIYPWFKEIRERWFLTKVNSLSQKLDALSRRKIEPMRHWRSKCQTKGSESHGATCQRFGERLLLLRGFEEKINRLIQISCKTTLKGHTKEAFSSCTGRIWQRGGRTCIHTCIKICWVVRRFNLIKCYKCKLIQSSEESCSNCTLKSSLHIKILFKAISLKSSNQPIRTKIIVLNEQRVHRKL